LCSNTYAIKATDGADIEIGPLCKEAADEIEGLREENQRLGNEIFALHSESVETDKEP
jgi:hypothetical protein